MRGDFEIRFDYVVVILVVLAVFIFGMFLLDSIFSNTYPTKTTKYSAEFDAIAFEFKGKNYEKVIALSERIVDQAGLGTNEIRAKVYIGLSKV